MAILTAMIPGRAGRNQTMLSKDNDDYLITLMVLVIYLQYY